MMLHTARLQRAIVILGCLSASTAGCRQTGGANVGPSPRGSLAPGDRPAMDSPWPANEPIRAVDLAFDVIRADLPADGARESRKIWNHVDELRTTPEAAARTARNGLRVGVASSGAWPAMLTVLENAGAELRRDEFFPQRGLPLAVAVERIAEPQAVFSYDADDRLSGNTFPAGEKLINLGYSFHPHLGGITELQLEFEIRHDQGVMTWQRREGIIRQEPAYDRHLFDALTTLLTVRPEEFLVIGPNADAENRYLVGNRFLMGRRDGRDVETLLFITPRPYQGRTVQWERP